MRQYDFSTLTPIMEPKKVAIIGASDSPARIGGRSLAYMLERRFDGELFPVNPQRRHVQGVEAFSAVADLPVTPDVAIVALPANLVSDTVDELVKLGTPSAIIFSSGFAEVGDEGAALQARIAQRAAAGNMRLLGPNSLGLINTRRNFWGTFSSSLQAGWPVEGRVGIASQSGAYGAHMLSLAVARNLGISAFITTGNEADITATDAIGWMANDENTDVIIAYLEGIKSGEKLIAALETARMARKPVIVMKAGRSMIGSQAAQSHTASLAGNDAVADAVFREYGALRIENTHQALDFAEAATKRIYPVSNTLGVLTVSGGAGILIADDAERLDLPMPPLPQATQSELLALLSFAATRNPVDCTAQAFNQIELIGDFGTKLVEAGDYKSLLIFLSHAGGHRSAVEPLREQLKRIVDAAPDCLRALCVIATPEVVKLYQGDGFLVFDDPARAVTALAAMGQLGKGFSKVKAPVGPELATIDRLSSVPNEKECKEIFSRAGITVPMERLVKTAQDAVGACAEIGFPVVMKIVSSDIIHKTEIGGVLLDVRDEQAASDGFALLIERARDARPDARIDGVLIAQKIEQGVECLLGIQRDPVFGPIAVFGLGGIFVEILKDVVLKPCPFDPGAAEDMIRSIRSFEMLKGARGREAVDLDALAKMLSHLSHLAVGLGDQLISIDINPVIATSRGAWAVDGVIEIETCQRAQSGKAEL
jgi:acyl-CoA synthetase (NDP forming)